MRGSAEIELRIDRHGGQAEQAAARGRIVVAVVRAVMMALGMGVRGPGRVDMVLRVRLRLRLAMLVRMGMPRTIGWLVHVQSELLLGETVRRMVGST